MTSDSVPPTFRSPRHPKPIAIADWQDAELCAEWHMREVLQLAEVTTTSAGADGGVDVSAQGVAAQVKHFHGKPVGAPDLQRLFGAALGQRTLFYSSSGYAKPAREYATTAGVALFSFDIYGTVTAVNPIAQAMVEQALMRRASRAAKQDLQAALKRSAEVTERYLERTDRRARPSAAEARAIEQSLVELRQRRLETERARERAKAAEAARREADETRSAVLAARAAAHNAKQLQRARSAKRSRPTSITNRGLIGSDGERSGIRAAPDAVAIAVERTETIGQRWRAAQARYGCDRGADASAQP